MCLIIGPLVVCAAYLLLTFDNFSLSSVSEKPLTCANCHAVWYHRKECQKKHWREHKKVCSILADSTRVQGVIAFKPAAISEKTLEALNQFTGDAKFLVSEESGAFVVEFASADKCKKWCNTANQHVFSRQQGSILMIRDGKNANDLGATFRLPLQLDEFLRYVGDGEIYVGESQSRFVCKPNKSKIGHWEVGFGKEPFEDWMHRQVEHLVYGQVVYQW